VIHLIALAVCGAVVAVAKVGLVRERKIHEELERKLIARNRRQVTDGALN
jgi:hypothetical protein